MNVKQAEALARVQRDMGILEDSIVTHLERATLESTRLLAEMRAEGDEPHYVERVQTILEALGPAWYAASTIAIAAAADAEDAIKEVQQEAVPS